MRDVAGQHGLSRSALDRHASSHVPSTLALGQQAAEIALSEDLVVHAHALLMKTSGVLSEAEKAGEARTMLAAIREARGCVELLMRLGVPPTTDDEDEDEGRVPNTWEHAVQVVLEEFARYPYLAINVANELNASAELVQRLEEVVPEVMWKESCRHARST